MADKHDERILTVDHANKLADRERENPNRRKLRLMRAMDGVPETPARSDREVSKAPKRERRA